MVIAKSLSYFVLAGLCEIGGGYLVCLWIRGGKSIYFALFGAVVQILYGVIPTHASASPFWKGLCSLWRYIHSTGYPLGMED